MPHGARRAAHCGARQPWRGVRLADRRCRYCMHPRCSWTHVRSARAGVVMLLASVLVACLLAEALTRIVIAARGHYPQKDPILHHSLQPHATMKRVQSEFQVVYRINSRGLRDEEIRLLKPPQVF